MIELQILSKILQTKSMSIISDNDLSEDYFNSYREQFKFIQDHYRKYGVVPDKETFIYEYPDFEIVDTKESDQFMADTIREEYVYAKTVPIINELADKMKRNSYDGVRYLQSEIEYLTQLVASKNPPLNLVTLAQKRLELYNKKKDDPENYYIPTGFQELDETLGGLDKLGDFMVIVMRTSQGKSWLLQNIITHAWKIGLCVGMHEPEMSEYKTGYRFDTLNGHFSNTAINRGQEAAGYEEYLQELSKKDNPFYLIPATERVDVPYVKKFIQDNKVDVMALDGISYIEDYRASSYDNKTTQLTHISEDLMKVSIELGVPIITVVQSNRDMDHGPKATTRFPDLFNVRDSDGIGFNATVVLSGYHDKTTLHLKTIKARDGGDQIEFAYHWDIDHGEFEFVPDNQSNDAEDEKRVEDIRQKYEQGEDMNNVF